MFNTFRKYGLFLIIPVTVLGFSVFLKLAAGPYWLATNFDPAYQYLINGLYIVKGIVPNHTDHPGTPLQILFCVVCWLFNIGRSSGDVVTHVLTAPEFYLHGVFIVLLLFSFLTSVALAIYVFRKTGDGLAAILTQLPAISFIGSVILVANDSPEPVLIGVVNLFNFCLFMNFFAKTPKDESLSTLFWGLVCGLGTALKLTFVPLLAIPLIILSLKNKIFFLVICAASFFIWTLPILSKYPALWGWTSNLLTHTGIHGSGQTGVIEIRGYALNWMNILVEQKVFVTLMFAGLALVFWKLVRKEWNRGAAFLAATMAGILFQFALVAKHPGAHYLLPGLGLFSSLLSLFYLQGFRGHVLGRRMAFVFIVIFIFAGGWQAKECALRLASLTQGMLAFDERVHDKYKDFIFVRYYRSSGQDAALQFGDGWNEEPHLGEELLRLYPNSFFFDRWADRIKNFKEVVLANDLLGQFPGVVFQGDGSFDFNPTPYAVRFLEKGPYESIYLLTGTSEKQAMMLFAAAMHCLQAQDYARALAFALQARAFHYQPDSTVADFIRLVGPYAHH